MLHPFQHISAESSVNVRYSLKRQASARVHVNNPYFHRYPIIKREKERFIQQYTGNIPFLHYIPLRIHFVLSIIFVSIVISLFALSFISAFQSSSAKFLSPYGGGNASSNCQVVPATTTGTFYATTDGRWLGGAAFGNPNAVYGLTLSSFAATQESYNELFDGVFVYLEWLGGNMTYLGLGENLLFWMSFALVTDSSNTNRFFLTGSPKYVFNRQFHHTVLGNEEAACSSDIITTFNRNTAEVVSSLRSELFADTNASCAKVLQLKELGYDFAFNKVIIKQHTDLRSVVTALAVNSGILKLYRLVHVSGMDKNVTVLNFSIPRMNNSIDVSLIISQYYDSKYPGMTPISCFEWGKYPFCFTHNGDIPSIPFFYHVGQQIDFPVPCNCFTMQPKEIEDSEHPCHEFRFITGHFFWNTRDLRPVLEMVAKNFYSAQGFRAAFLSSIFGVKSENPTLRNETFRRESFDFCRTSNGSCSVLSISSYDLYPNGRTISSQYFQLVHGACTDSLKPNVAALKKLKADPYAPLFQAYQVCRNDLRSRLLDSTGIAVGNVTLLRLFPVIVVIMLGLVYNCCWATYIKPDEEEIGSLCDKNYTRTERRLALDALASALRMHNDALFTENKDCKGIASEAFLRELAEELIRENTAENRKQALKFMNSRLKGDTNASMSGSLTGSAMVGSVTHDSLQLDINDPKAIWTGFMFSSTVDNTTAGFRNSDSTTTEC